MKMHVQGLARLVLLVALPASLVACKKAEPPTPSPEPTAAQTEVTQSDSGTTTTFAPSFASAIAVCNPMPELAPVTTHVLSLMCLRSMPRSARDE